MTRTYALKRLLEHGPLNMKELMAITGWKNNQIHHAIECLIQVGIVTKEKASSTKYVYRLAA